MNLKDRGEELSVSGRGIEVTGKQNFGYIQVNPVRILT